MLIALAGHGAPANGALFQGDAATTLDAASCDLVLPPNSWHELDDHPVALREAARILRLDGRRAILDWRTTPSARPARRSITASPCATPSAFSSAPAELSTTTAPPAAIAGSSSPPSPTSPSSPDRGEERGNRERCTSRGGYPPGIESAIGLRQRASRFSARPEPARRGTRRVAEPHRRERIQAAVAAAGAHAAQPRERWIAANPPRQPVQRSPDYRASTGRSRSLPATTRGRPWLSLPVPSRYRVSE